MGSGEEITNQMMLFPDPATNLVSVKGASLYNAERNARFPWTHKREPVDFHSTKILPWKNQTAVPSY